MSGKKLAQTKNTHNIENKNKKNESHYTDHLSHVNSRQLTHLNKALAAVCMSFSYVLFGERAIPHVIVHVDRNSTILQ